MDRFVLFQKDYYGFEDISDLTRDIHEAFDPSFNEEVKKIPNEFQGTIKVTLEYVEK